MRSFSILLLALLLMAAPAVTSATPDTVATVSADREYPNGWTHRPLVELFTSLSCVFCMSYADPAMDEVLHDIEGDSSVPYHIVYFHQPNGGAGDDPFHTEDSNARMRDHYGQTGTPNAQFDGNYRYEGGGSESNYDDYKAELEDSGPRDGDDGEDFKIVDLDIYSEFIGSSTEGEVGTFKVRVDMTYHGLAGPESWEQQAGLEDTNLDGTLYVFMVEDDVTAWSSYLEQDWVNMRVFRGYAIEGEEFTLQKDEAATYEAVWKVPTTQVDADGVEGPIRFPSTLAGLPRLRRSLTGMTPSRAARTTIRATTLTQPRAQSSRRRRRALFTIILSATCPRLTGSANSSPKLAHNSRWSSRLRRASAPRSRSTTMIAKTTLASGR